MMRKKHRDCAGSRRAGFTLIELLVVIAIIGVLFAVAMPIFENAGRKDPERAAYQVMSTLRLARQHAIAKRQWTMVVFPTRDSGNTFPEGHLDKCLRGYAVLAATNNLDGAYRPEWGASLRDPPLTYMELTFVSDWKLLPEGIYFDDDTVLTGNYIFGCPNKSQPTYTGAFPLPLDPAKPNVRNQKMGVVLFKPNGRAFVMHDSSAKGKFWQDVDYSRIYLTSAKYYDQEGNTLTAPKAISAGTNTSIYIRNKTGQMHIADGSTI
jgi:prepilin-type N-terminal cleavage/methylation domain-containing protein